MHHVLENDITNCWSQKNRLTWCCEPKFLIFDLVKNPSGRVRWDEKTASDGDPQSLCFLIDQTIRLTRNRFSWVRNLCSKFGSAR